MDDDLIFGVIGVLVCCAPVVFLAFLAWIAGRSRTGSDPRVSQLEAELGATKAQMYALGQRLQRLETWASTVRAVEPQAAPVTSPVIAPAVVAAVVEAAAVASESAGEGEGASESTRERTSERTSESTSTTESATTPAVETAAAIVESTPAVVSAPSASSSPPATVSAVPPPAPTPPRSSTPTFPTQEEGGLERWLGVRGAAAAGAIILAIAGAYFFEYSIEHGLIGPAARVALGVLVGLGCLGLSEWKREEYAALTSWLAGAGIAILYTASWASHAIYDLVPSWGAGLLMIAVTAACAAISSRRDSLPTAVLGLMGGFITPLALSTGEDRPVPLFSYLLLLDVGLLWLSYRRRWPSLAWLSLIGTAVYQLGWLGGRMTSESGGLGIGVILVFGLLYGGYSTMRASRREDGAPASDQPFLAAVSTLLPFVLALTFAGRDVLSDHLYVVGALVTVLSLGAIFVAHRANAPLVSLAGATGSLGVVSVWMLSHPLDAMLSWELAATLVVVALVYHAYAELQRESLVASSAALIALFGGAFLATVASVTVTTLPPFVVITVVLAILGARHAELPGRAWAAAISGLALAGGLFAIEQAAPSTEQTFYAALSMVLVALYQVPAFLPRSISGRQGADHGAAIAALTLALMRVFESWGASVPVEIGGQLVLAVLVLLAASRLAMPVYAAGALVLAASASTLAVLDRGAHDDAIPSLVIMGISVLVFATWPSLAGPRYRSDAWAWRTAPMAGPLFFFAMRTTWLRAFGPNEIGVLPVSLAIVSLGALFLARARGPADDATRRTALAWPAAITAGFVTLAIPLQLSNEWLTIGWALEAAAVLWLFRRIDHAGLKWLAAILFAAVATRLLVNPYVLGYYPRGSMRIVNWIAYTYLVPAAAMVASYLALAPIEVDRLRPLESTVYPSPAPHLARTLFAGALATIFAWINLAIFDWYASGPALSIPTEHMPARDLTISIAWALYALVMLGLGVWRQSGGLRWTSLALIIITCFKVFLYDLSHLHDLYRVAALVGLAMSLLLVSLLYQRFVFRRTPAPVAAPETAS